VTSQALFLCVSITAAETCSGKSIAPTLRRIPKKCAKVQSAARVACSHRQVEKTPGRLHPLTRRGPKADRPVEGWSVQRARSSTSAPCEEQERNSPRSHPRAITGPLW